MFIKVSGDTLRFESPIPLDPNKEYQLGMSALMFTTRKTFEIKNFKFSFTCGLYDLLYAINGTFNVNSFKAELISHLTSFQSSLLVKSFLERMIKKFGENQMKEIQREIQKVNLNSLKFDLEHLKDDSYRIAAYFPMDMRILDEGNFCDIFQLKNCLGSDNLFKKNTNYVSNINPKQLVFSDNIAEWHCNITEYSLTNHDEHPHLHVEHELLHVSFIDKPLPPNTVYTEKPKKVVFIPLRKGLKEIKIIKLSTTTGNNEQIQFDDIKAYLLLKSK